MKLSTSGLGQQGNEGMPFFSSFVVSFYCLLLLIMIVFSSGIALNSKRHLIEYLVVMN